MTPAILETYSDALDYLYGFVNWEVARHDRYSPDAMTLERPRRLLEALGEPQATYSVVHLTGTKGKGSVGAMLASILKASGLRVGLYSSPHLQDFRERFRIDNQLISQDQLLHMVRHMRPVLDSLEDITWFEVTTALAFEFFRQQTVDIAVVEVGLGGRLDATNVVTPLVSVITSLSYDHTYLLGDSLASIAREKGGIIKPGIPVVSAPQEQEALTVLKEISSERNAALTVVGRDWSFEAGEYRSDGQVFRVQRSGEPPSVYTTALAGEHQALNATVALAALEHVRQYGIAISEQAIRMGLLAVDWPGRLELVDREPLLLLDAAHNAESAQRLHDALVKLYPQRPLALVLGASADKDIAGIFEALLPIVDYLILAQAVHPRALAPGQLAEIARATGYDGPIDELAATDEALARASELVGPDGLVCGTGSLFLVGELRDICELPVGHVPRLSRSSCATHSSGD